MAHAPRCEHAGRYHYEQEAEAYGSFQYHCRTELKVGLNGFCIPMVAKLPPINPTSPPGRWCCDGSYEYRYHHFWNGLAPARTDTRQDGGGSEQPQIRRASLDCVQKISSKVNSSEVDAHYLCKAVAGRRDKSCRERKLVKKFTNIYATRQTPHSRTG